MPPSFEINPIQASILRQLYRQGPRRFAELNTEDVSSDQFSYHVRYLLKEKLIQKTVAGTYHLTVLGKSRANLLSRYTPHYVRQGFVATRIVLSKYEASQKLFLVQRRTKDSFKGMLALPGGKVLFGDDIQTAANYYMYHETRLRCDLSLSGVTHFKDKYQGEIVQDKYFFVFCANNPVGQLASSGETGKNLWLPYREIQNSPDAHQGLLQMIDMAEGDSLAFAEDTFPVTEY